MRGSLARRLERIEGVLNETSDVYELEDGSTARLPAGAEIRALMLILRAEDAAAEAGQPVTVPDHPHMQVFAKIVTRGWEGEIVRLVHNWCREHLNGDTA